MSLFSFPAEVNERAARLVAVTVATSLSAAAALGWTWVVPIFAIGFLLRVGWGPRFSPLARVAMWTASRLGPPKLKPGPPKRFAQGIGAVCTIAATALFALGAPRAGWGIVAMIVVFAALEATVAFCMGCWVYARLQQIGVFPPDACVDCAAAIE